VIEKFGVPPEKVVEVQALAGDSVDNVPGVPGIGIKTAAQLITEYGDLETLLARAGEIKQPKRREALIENADKARISRQLVLLDDMSRSTCRWTTSPCMSRIHAQADRLPEGDGIHHADAPRRRLFADRGRRMSKPIQPDAAHSLPATAARGAPALGDPFGAGYVRTARFQTPPSGPHRTPAAAAKAAHPATGALLTPQGARACPRRKAHNAKSTAPNTNGDDAAERLKRWIARARIAACRDRHRDDRRSIRCRPSLRLLARARAE
jgi:hypothetical protein